MKNRIKKIIGKETAFLKVTLEEFTQFAERGCHIAFGDDLITRIAIFSG